LFFPQPIVPQPSCEQQLEANMNVNKVLLALGLSAAVAPMIMAQEATIKVWHHSGQGGEREAMAATVKSFNDANNGVNVELVTLPEGSFNDQVNAAALADKLPCVLDFDGPNTYNYAWTGKLVPMDKYIDAETKANILPSIISQGTYNGKLYSLGQFDSGLAIWGNKALLSKAGVRIPTNIKTRWTRSEFDGALRKLKASGLAFPLDMKFNYGVGEWFTYGFSPILQSFGGDLIDRNGYQKADGTINGSASVKAMTYLQGLVKKGYINTKPAGDTDFVEKKAALSYVGHWTYNDYKKAIGDDLVLLPMPRFGVRTATGSGSWNFGITSDCKNQDGAAKFVKFLMSDSEVARAATASGAVPATKSVLNKDARYAAGGPLSIFVEQLEGGVAVVRPVTPAYPTITAAFAEAMNNIVAGGNVKAELDKAAKKIDQNISDNKGYPNK
jgi:multiple sugar transport system substrate-binding protein